MKCLIVIALIFTSTDAFLKSGTLNLSGTFQSHPILANHPLLANHRLFGGSQSTVPPPIPADPVVVETSSTESTVAVQSDTSSGSGYTHSFHSKIDFNKILNDIVGVKTILLKHIQEGINQKFDSKLKRLEKFETQLKNHFNKNSAAPSNTNVALDATVSTPDNGVAFDANLSVNTDSRFAPEINIITNESSSTGSSDSDFDLADSSLNASKNANLSGPEPTASNCDH